MQFASWSKMHRIQTKETKKEAKIGINFSNKKMNDWILLPDITKTTSVTKIVDYTAVTTDALFDHEYIKCLQQVNVDLPRMIVRVDGTQVTTLADFISHKLPVSMHGIATQATTTAVMILMFKETEKSKCIIAENVDQHDRQHTVDYIYINTNLYVCHRKRLRLVDANTTETIKLLTLELVVDCSNKLTSLTIDYTVPEECS